MTLATVPPAHMLRPEGGSGGPQERALLLECEMEAHIPAAPLAVADLDAFFTMPKAARPPQRRYVIQGEELHFYLLVRCPPPSAAGAVEARAILSQLAVKVHFAEAGAMKGILMMEKKKARIMDDHPRHNAVVSGPNSPSIITLSNGDLLYSLQASMAVRDEFLNRTFHIVVTVAMPPAAGDATDLPSDAASLRTLLGAAMVADRSPARTVILEVELQQPLAVTFTRVHTAARTIVRIAAENRHPTLPLSIHDLQFLKNYTKLAREAGGSPMTPRKPAEALRTTDGADKGMERKAIPENLNFKEYFSVVLEAVRGPLTR